jgi:hypothetical protein
MLDEVTSQGPFDESPEPSRPGLHPAKLRGIERVAEVEAQSRVEAIVTMNGLRVLLCFVCSDGRGPVRDIIGDTPLSLIADVIVRAWWIARRNALM